MDSKHPRSKGASRKKEWNSSSFSIKENSKKKQNNISISTIKTSGLVAIVSIVVWFLYRGFLETRINTPLGVPNVITEVGLDVPTKYWGIYRPGVYFGTKVRHPLSPVTGLMWYTDGHFQNNMLAIRHWCEQGDDIDHYGWKEHDGHNFGFQTINDKYISLNTYFVKRPEGKYGGDWSARIEVLPKMKQSERNVSLFYYVALDPEDSEAFLKLSPEVEIMSQSLKGFSSALGNFQLRILEHSGSIAHRFHLSTKHVGLHMLKESLLKGLRLLYRSEKKHSDKIVGLGGDVFDHNDKNKSPNFLVFQVTGKPPFAIDVLFESQESHTHQPALTGDILSLDIEKYSKKFNNQFEDIFGLKAKGFSDKEVSFAKAALSNMLGGIGYFYGSSKVQGENNKVPVPYWKAPLYTAVPSRSFFPRGFLWDEGFHNILISKWDPKISMDILGHWLDLINWDGWIPREQILGVEARARVPDEFVVQNMKAANPPTLLLTLHSLTDTFKEYITEENTEFLERMWPRLKAWYHWFNTTQLGSLPGSYRWRGRDPNALKELNPKTLTSGLDDYPRASHPSVDERHLDLRCWMTLAAGLMVDIAKLVGKDPTKFDESFHYLSDNNLLDSLHWSYSSNGYMDYGLHTDKVVLKRLDPKLDKVRVSNSVPKEKFVDSFGYVSFFPLFLQIIDPYSVKLRKVLEDIKRRDLLWTPYGLRSLAANSRFYNEWNTEHDPPYWRGSIWINMNFLAVRSLHYYSRADGPNKDLAKEIYEELRHNIIKTVTNEYYRSGYVWEHYNDKTGKGEGCRPFTGWSSLVVLIMGETYY